MEIYTAGFFTYFGAGRVSIARYRPKNMLAIPEYLKLTPSGRMLKIKDKQVYRKMYYEQILNKLDPDQVVADIIEITDAEDAYLLCWEKPPFWDDNFCHRRLVAEWLEQETGIIVREHVRSRL